MIRSASIQNLPAVGGGFKDLLFQRFIIFTPTHIHYPILTRHQMGGFYQKPTNQRTPGYGGASLSTAFKLAKSETPFAGEGGTCTKRWTMGRIGGSDACVFFSELIGWVGLVGLVGWGGLVGLVGWLVGWLVVILAFFVVVVFGVLLVVGWHESTNMGMSSMLKNGSFVSGGSLISKHLDQSI